MRVLLDKLEGTSPKYDEVYVMMAAIPHRNSEVIFVLKDKATNEKAYLNFTQPCPDMCPW